MPHSESQATWKRERPLPLFGPPVPPAPPVWNPKQPARRPRRGPWQKLLGMAVGAIVIANVLSATPSYADAQDTCDMSDGPDNVNLGALLYVRETMDDAIEKYHAYKQGDMQALRNIEMDNDYICWIPRSQQATLRFMTENLLIFVLDIMQLD